MSKKFKVWLDSGANHDSKYEQEVSLGDLGCTDDEWEAMTEEAREEMMKSAAWENMEWGFTEIED